MKGNTCLDRTVLQEFLSADGIQELRSKIIDVIVEQVREDLRNEYILKPDDVTEEICVDVINEAVKEIKDEYKKAVKKVVEKKLYESGLQL